MSNWPATKARRVLAALQRIGWAVKRQSGSHRTLSHPDRPDSLKLATGFRNVQVEWLGDAERPIFFHTHVIELYQGAIDNLLAALRQAIKLVEDNPDAREWKKNIAELRRIERRNGFSARARGSNRK